MEMRPISTSAETTIGDYRRYPGCRVVIACTGCGWRTIHGPEQVIDRLRALKAGGHATSLVRLAGRVTKRCPLCRQVAWRAGFGWPASLRESDIRRLANLYRN
jgi:hypothetical protein